MFLIAQSTQELAIWGGADCEAKARVKKSTISFTAFSQKEERHEYDTSSKNVLIDIYRQMDTKNLVFS
jgi:hypothetical protein